MNAPRRLTEAEVEGIALTMRQIGAPDEAIKLVTESVRQHGLSIFPGALAREKTRLDYEFNRQFNDVFGRDR